MTREDLKRKYLNAPAYLSLIEKGTEFVEKQDWEGFAAYRKSVMRLISLVGLYKEFGEFLDDHYQMIIEELTEE